MIYDMVITVFCIIATGRSEVLTAAGRKLPSSRDQSSNLLLVLTGVLGIQILEMLRVI